MTKNQRNGIIASVLIVAIITVPFVGLRSFVMAGLGGYMAYSFVKSGETFDREDFARATFHMLRAIFAVASMIYVHSL